jgi:hypothetical protein
MPISRKTFSKKRTTKKSVKKNTRKHKKRKPHRKDRKSGKRFRFFGGNPLRYIVQLESINQYNGHHFLNNNDLIQLVTVNMGMNIGINDLSEQIKQLILHIVNNQFSLQLQQNDINVLVDGNHLVIQVQPNLDQYINDTVITNGLPNFISQITFLRMTNLGNDMDAEGNPEVLIDPMQNLNIDGNQLEHNSQP